MMMTSVKKQACAKQQDGRKPSGSTVQTSEGMHQAARKLRAMHHLGKLASI